MTETTAQVNPTETAKPLNEHLITQLVKNAMKPSNLTHGVFAVFLLLLFLVGLGTLGFFTYEARKEAKAAKDETRLINAHYVVMSQQTVLLGVLNDNLRNSKDAKLGSAPIDQKVAVAKMMYDMSILEKVPLHILCGIAETESSWNTSAVSSAGCVGLLMVTPAYARLVLQAKGVDYKPGIFFDPSYNVMCGIKMLSNNQAEHVENGRTTANNWTLALHSYLWGPTATNTLFGKVDKRVDIPNMAYPQRIIEASKKYKDKGL